MPSILEIVALIASRCLAGVAGQDPIFGKFCGTTWRPTQASRLRYTCLTALLTYINCKVEMSWPLSSSPEISTIMPPVNVIGSDEAPSILACSGKIESGWIFNSERKVSGHTFIWAPESMIEDLVTNLGLLCLPFNTVGVWRPRLL